MCSMYIYVKLYVQYGSTKSSKEEAERDRQKVIECMFQRKEGPINGNNGDERGRRSHGGGRQERSIVMYIMEMPRPTQCASL